MSCIKFIFHSSYKINFLHFDSTFRITILKLFKNIRKSPSAVFLNVAKALGDVKFDDLLYNFTVLNFPSYHVRIFSSYVYDRTSKLPHPLVIPSGLAWLSLE